MANRRPASAWVHHPIQVIACRARWPDSDCSDRLSIVERLVYQERPAHGDADGLLILHHGRGTDEHDLLGLADVLDRGQRLHVVTPRAPLTLPGWQGYHWYVVPEVGYPDPETFQAAYAQLTQLHEELWERTGIPPERTVLGGFSMGCVMSYATGLGEGRPVPAGIVAFSGFIPTVEGWQADLEPRHGLPVFIAHGRADQVISIQFAHRARTELEAVGMPVEYHEGAGGHQIDPTALGASINWLAGAV
jgi:phospholipase/carboxylesterase